MECSEFRKCISAFAEQKLKPKQASECLKHVENCASCMDELEIYFIVEYGIKEDAVMEGPFILKNIISNCLENVRRGMIRERRVKGIILLTRFLSYLLLLAAIIFLITIWL